MVMDTICELAFTGLKMHCEKLKYQQDQSVNLL